MHPEDQINPAEQVERIREILIGRDIKLVNERIHELESSVQDNTSEVARNLSQQLEKAEQQHQSAQENIQTITTHIRQQLEQESITRGQQIQTLAEKIDAAAARMDHTTQQLLNQETGHTHDLSKKIENLSSEMASRIDAHSRQIMEHMHREIQQWKTRMDGQISTLTEKKVDRQELSSRLARIASAAMGDSSLPATNISPTIRANQTPLVDEASVPDAPFAAPLMSAPAPPAPTQHAPVQQTPIQPAPPNPPNLSSLDAFTMPTDDFTT